jgi:hypothetical protein
MIVGSAGGSPPPPGAPVAQTSGNFAIIGGTGAFLGVRGQYGQVPTAQSVAVRLASMAEDPGNRRTNGGGRVRYVLHLIPGSVPQITSTAGTPAAPSSAHPASLGVGASHADGQTRSGYWQNDVFADSCAASPFPRS